MSASFARPFRVTLPDDVLNGVQFPSGRCVLEDDQEGLVHGAVTFDDLDLPSGAVVEWQDGGQP